MSSAGAPSRQLTPGLVRQAAALSLRIEQLQASIVSGEPVNNDETVRLSSEHRRILASLRVESGQEQAGPVARGLVGGQTGREGGGHVSAPTISLIDALTDPGLFEPWFRGESWNGWRAVVKAMDAQPMTDDEIAFFKSIAGGRNPPKHPVKNCGPRARAAPARIQSQVV